MPASGKEYRRVLQTYLHRPAFSRLLVPSLIAWIAWLLWKVYSIHGQHWWMQSAYHSLADVLESIDPIFFFLPFVVLYTYVALLMAHIREQLDNPRADIVPNYRTPHLVIASIAFLSAPVVGVAVTLITEWSLGLIGASYPLGLLAIAMTALAPAAWWASSRSPWMALLAIPLVLLLMIWTPIGLYFAHLANGRLPYSGVMSFELILIDLGFLGLLFVRLMFLKPEASAPVAEAMFGSQPGPRTLPLTRHAPLLTAMARVWHRRRGVLDPSAPWAVAGLLAVILVGFKLIHGASNDDLLRSLLLPAGIPGAIVSAVWRERLMNLQFESLYPASHRNFINELLGAAALSLIEMWVTTLLAVLTPILIWHNQLATHMPLVLGLIAASAVMQVFVFGVMLVASLRGNLILYANVLTLTAVVMPMAFAFGNHASLSLRGLMGIATIEMVVGILLILYGTVAWRRADLA